MSHPVQDTFALGNPPIIWNVIPTEGGRQPFALLDKYKREVRSLLRDANGYVTFALICSGGSLVKTYQTTANIQGYIAANLGPSDIT